jgi:hypothetical protein
MKRKLSIGRGSVVGVLVASMAAASLAGALAAGSNSGRGTVRMERQTFKWFVQETAFESLEFQPLQRLDRVQVLRSGDVSVTLSVVVGGGPGEIRVVGAGNRVLKPGVIPVDASASSTVSFTFVQAGGRDPSCTSFAVEGRMTGVDPLMVKRGTLTITYNFDRTNDDGVKIACPD